MSAPTTSTGWPACSSAWMIPATGCRGSSGSSQRSTPGRCGRSEPGLATRATRSQTPASAAAGYQASGRPATSIAAFDRPPSRRPRPPARSTPIIAFMLPCLAVGTFISVGRSLETAMQRAAEAERLGYASAYVTHVTGRDSQAVLAAYSTRTERILLGTGVLPIYSRTPAACAQIAATIDEMAGGRLVLGLGVSHRVTVENWYGQEIGKPVREMREYATTVRAILNGQPPPADNEKFRTSFQFMGYAARPDFPIYIAALSPAMLRLAGEIGDGVILWLCNPEYIRDVVVPEVTRGREKAGKPLDGFDIVAAVPSAVTDELEQARAKLRKDLVPYFSLPFYRAMIERSGYEDDVAGFDEGMSKGDPDAAVGAISDRFLKTLTAIGDQSDAVASIERYLEAGATSPCVGAVAQTDFDATLEALATLAGA